MARPKKSLLQRCQERSFRVRHHWHLLVSEPDLPWPSLAELQQRAREAETEEAVKEIGRVFERTLDSLPAEELHLLLPTRPPAGADDPGGQGAPASASARVRNEAFLATVEAALAELSTRFRTQLSAREEIEAELIRRATERLVGIDQGLAEEGLTVLGSQRQLRPHPLLSFEDDLRRELMQNLRQLEFRVQNRAILDRMQALSRDPARRKQRPDQPPLRKEEAALLRPRRRARGR